jgi:hypothetical protein
MRKLLALVVIALAGVEASDGIRTNKKPLHEQRRKSEAGVMSEMGRAAVKIGSFVSKSIDNVGARIRGSAQRSKKNVQKGLRDNHSHTLTSNNKKKPLKGSK